MVKILKRKLNRRYKGKDHLYDRYVLEIPARFYDKVQAYVDFALEMEMTFSETHSQHTCTIVLIRKK